MKVSTKGRYALRLMVDLGVNGGEDKYISLKDISARQNISIKYLEQIVTPLHRAGLVRSVRGAQGGYRLSRKADKYTAGGNFCAGGRKAFLRLREVLHRSRVWKHRKMSVSVIMTARL